MAFITHPPKEPVFVFITEEIEDYGKSGYFTIGHRFRVYDKIITGGQTCLVDDESECAVSKHVYAYRHQFEVIKD